MKAALAAIALTTLAVAAPIGAAHASGGVTIRVDTPEFGIRVGTPLRIHAPVPVYSPPVYIPRVVYAPPAPVVYLPPRVVVRPPVAHHVTHRHRHWSVREHWHDDHWRRHHDHDGDYRGRYEHD